MARSPISHPDRIRSGAFWRKVRAVAGHVPFLVDVVAAYFAMRDRATPLRHKMVLAGAIAYFILPVDAIPDLILPMGFADDAAAITAALTVARMSIHDIHRAQARRTLGLVVPSVVAPPD